MQALVRFVHIAAGGTFRTAEIHSDAAQAFGSSTSDYKLGFLRYDLSKLREWTGGEVTALHSRSCRLTPEGYQICLVYLKLFEKVYAPLTQGILQPFPTTIGSCPHAPACWIACIEPLSRLWMNSCRRWIKSGLTHGATNENKIHVTNPIRA